MMSANGSDAPPEEVNPSHDKKNKDRSPKIPEYNLDLNDRDPHKLNPHLHLTFSEIIGEPEPGTYSFDQIWIYSNHFFGVTKLWCYRVLTLLCAIPAAICWGVLFACLSFCSIWCEMPCLKCCRMRMHCVQTCYGILMGTFIGPAFDAIGRCFGHIKVTLTKGSATSESSDKLNV